MLSAECGGQRPYHRSAGLHRMGRPNTFGAWIGRWAGSSYYTAVEVLVDSPLHGETVAAVAQDDRDQCSVVGCVRNSTAALAKLSGSNP